MEPLDPPVSTFPCTVGSNWTPHWSRSFNQTAALVPVYLSRWYWIFFWQTRYITGKKQMMFSLQTTELFVPVAQALEAFKPCQELHSPKTVKKCLSILF